MFVDSKTKLSIKTINNNNKDINMPKPTKIINI